MERKSVAVSTLLVLLGLGGLGYVTRDKWGEPVKVSDLPQATAPAEPAKPATPEAPAQTTAQAPAATDPAKPETATPEAAKPETTTPETAEAPKAAAPAASEPAKPAESQVAVAEPPKAVEAPAQSAAAAPEAPAATPAPAPAVEDLPLPSIGTVRIEKDGAAVIAGRAEPGSTVTVKLNDTVVASGTANAAGDFAIIPDKPLPAQAGVLTVEMAGKDGKVTASEQTVAIIGRDPASEPKVAVLTPGAPTKFVQSGEPDKAKLPPMATVMIDTVDYDDKGNMVFSGRGPAGSKVQLYADNKLVAEGPIGADGTWVIVPPPETLTVGPHELRADEVAADGSVKSRVGMPFYREEPAKVLASKAQPQAPETVTINQQVTVTTPDKKTVVTANGPVTIELKQTGETAAAAAPEAPAAEAPAAPAAEAPVAAAPAAEAPAAPAAAEPEATEPAAEPPKQVAAVPPVDPDALNKSLSKVIIQPGNNLWRLSRRIYGKGTMYTVIYEANREFIKNPNLIYPGQIFTTPKTATGN